MEIHELSSDFESSLFRISLWLFSHRLAYLWLFPPVYQSALLTGTLGSLISGTEDLKRRKEDKSICSAGSENVIDLRLFQPNAWEGGKGLFLEQLSS
jgi:hypothetical protein